MGGLSWSELLVVGIVALIVVGPKDLPKMFRTVGRFVGKARGMAREFSRAMNDAADETGMKDMASSLKAATNPVGSALDGVKDAAKSMTSLDIDPDSETGKLAAERAASAKKIEANTARMNAERKKREAEEAAKTAQRLEAEAKEAQAATAKDEDTA